MRLTAYFQGITSFKEACEALKLDFYKMEGLSNNLKSVSRASAATFKLNIIRKALHGGELPDFTNQDIFVPYIKFVNKDISNTPRKTKLPEIGNIIYYSKTFTLVAFPSCKISAGGLGSCSSDSNSGYLAAKLGLLGCATVEIANHLSLHFGTLIVQALYGDVKGIQKINKYLPQEK